MTVYHQKGADYLGMQESFFARWRPPFNWGDELNELGSIPSVNTDRPQASCSYLAALSRIRSSATSIVPRILLVLKTVNRITY